MTLKIEKPVSFSNRRQAKHITRNNRVYYPLRQPGYPRGARGFASRNCLRFASIGESNYVFINLSSLHGDVKHHLEWGRVVLVAG